MSNYHTTYRSRRLENDIRKLQHYFPMRISWIAWKNQIFQGILNRVQLHRYGNIGRHKRLSFVIEHLQLALLPGLYILSICEFQVVQFYVTNEHTYNIMHWAAPGTAKETSNIAIHNSYLYYNPWSRVPCHFMKLRHFILESKCFQSTQRSLDKSDAGTVMLSDLRK